MTVTKPGSDLRYQDFFTVRKEYTPCMSLRSINSDKRRWLDYYPHDTFVDLLNKLLYHFDNPKRSLWITGGYGTGKTHAVLVLQKLFNDDESRVMEWLDFHKKIIPQATRETLLKRRAEKTLVVYDNDTTGVNPHDHFLVRIERAIVGALKDCGLKNPPKGRVDEVVEKVAMLGKHFFTARDAMQEQLPHLNAGIETVDKLGKLLREKNCQ